MDYQIQRERMVQEQLIARGIKDKDVLQAMRKIPRHLFVEDAFALRAYGDHPLPIGEKQTISQPYMVGYMAEALAVNKKSRVLEIGTGSGYQTAVLAEICQKVYSVERIKSLAQKAQKLLEQLGYHNFQILVDDGSRGWLEKAPFQGIIISASAPSVPLSLCEQLEEGGRMVVPVGTEKSQILRIVHKKNGRIIEEEKLHCSFVKLIGEYGWSE
ncbi:MAG: protein-L-isoaspartate(D-aspartate) O-methyltransferase [bacterium]